ncbi:MAG: hypothetical protein PF445_04865 [Melioribacteraceae bacterium]|jgi:YVTN family beta-propeller protein|nr:hypothetical protein [Melioribacteraceae bacterium]
MKSFSKLIFVVISLFLINSCSSNKEEKWLIKSPSVLEYTQLFFPDSAVIPNGRKITPIGKQIKVAPHPYGLVVSPDGSMIVTANSGIKPFSVSIIKNLDTDEPTVIQIPDSSSDEGILEAVYMGLAISPDNNKLFVAGGQEGVIYIFDLNTYKKLGEIDCKADRAGRDVKHSYIGDMVLSSDGNTLYVLDQVQFEMLMINTDKMKIKKTVKVGRYPFGITLSPDEKKAFIANVGVFEYKRIEGIDNDRLKEMALEYPASPYLSTEMIEGIETDSIQIPPLGDPNVPESFSVWTVDLNKEQLEVVSKTKTGFLIGEMVDGIPAVGGSSPNSVVSTDKYVFVSNGNNDCISVIDIKRDTIITNILLSPDKRIKHLRGIIPFGLTLSTDSKYLYVAESGINAVAVIDVENLKVLGHFPVGWFPAKLKVSKDGKKLYVANAKGFGSGPNAGPNFDNKDGTYIGNLMNGVVSIIDIPCIDQLEDLTQKVISNNFQFTKFVKKVNDNPIPLYPGEKESPIKHIVFISKENRTYDEVFGQVKRGKGLPSIARFGNNQNLKNKKNETLENVNVMVNHLELAKKYSIADNFYCDSDVSADGHRWLVSTYPNEWVEVNVASSSGGGRSMMEDPDAPGNLAFVGSTGAIYPEDYNEAGSIWEHMDRNNIDFFNFGFGLELAPPLSDLAFKYTGVRYVINYPVPAPMFDKSSKKYATFNTSIPDQFRVDMFFEEFNERWKGKNKQLPSVLTILLPNDHGSRERPNEGYPFFESYMADNDLALGRIVEFLSKTKYWKNMAIVITEDDAQGGVDHVDAHRSILMVISPYAKKDFVGHVHYSFGSIFKTFWNILGIPYLNQYDAGANDFNDMFTSTPDFTPYKAKMVDQRIFNPDKALDPFDAEFNWGLFNQDKPIDNIETMKEQHKDIKE